MIGKKLRLCLGRYRYIISGILITIVLLIVIKNKGNLPPCLDNKNCSSRLLNEFSDQAKKYIYFAKENQSTTWDTPRLRRWIIRQNARRYIFNMDLYGPVTANTLVLVIRVHQYSCNINYLLASLSEVEGIQDTLIVFSHSYVDHNLNRLIQSIDFCKVLQLFYPYSIQAYPDEFPGYGINDCPPNINTELAVKINCTSAMTPDVYGRYRDPINAEKKHHWWWTANIVFEDLLRIKKHTGIVVFVENNVYIYKHFIYMITSLNGIAETFPQCDFLSLNTKLDVEGGNMRIVEFTNWNPDIHSQILAIDISTWKIIKAHYNIFCRTDDYSWSRSLFDISLNRGNGKEFKVISCVAARSLPIDCFSVDMMDCHVVEDIIEVINLHKLDKEALFPTHFYVVHAIEFYADDLVTGDYSEVNGGWNDKRDKQLCSNMTIHNPLTYFVTTEKKLNLGTY